MLRCWMLTTCDMITCDDLFNVSNLARTSHRQMKIKWLGISGLLRHAHHNSQNANKPLPEANPHKITKTYGHGTLKAVSLQGAGDFSLLILNGLRLPTVWLSVMES